MSQSWIFQPNKYWFGWDETGLSIFGGQPIRSLVRELIQNSLDAKADDAERVKVKFELNTVAKNMIPDIERLTQVMECCVSASADESEDSKADVKEAADYCNRMNFHVLSCTDFGTNGMKGPYKKGQDFYTYMNSKGSSPGDSKRAGSHGHGKDAPLVNSAIRTLFASSTYLDEDGLKQHLAQGKCVFMSHFQDDEQFENIGRWGQPDMSPVIDLPSQHQWINPYPNELGTTISIVGFTGKGQDWISEMIGHALINYFPAFVKNLLEVEFKDGSRVIKLNAENFTDFLTSTDVRSALEAADKDLVSELERTAYFVSAMMESRGGKLRDQQAKSPLNLVHFNLFVEDDAPRAYCLIRRNMKICEKLPNLQRISSKYSNFAVVIECQNDEANGLIRSMEPSEHDRIEPARLKKDKKADGDKLWKLLKEKFTTVMDQEAMPEQRISGQVDFLAKFFPDLANEDTGVSFEEDDGYEGDRYKLTPRKVKKKRRRITLVDTEDSVDPPDTPPTPRPDDPVDPPETPPGTPPDVPPTKPLGKLVKLQGEIKNQRVVELGDRKARLILRLDTEHDCYISLSEVGLDQADFLPIEQASVGELINGKVSLTKEHFQDDQKIILEVEVGRAVIGGYIVNVEVAEQ